MAVREGDSPSWLAGFFDDPHLPTFKIDEISWGTLSKVSGNATFSEKGKNQIQFACFLFEFYVQRKRTITLTQASDIIADWKAQTRITLQKLWNGWTFSPEEDDDPEDLRSPVQFPGQREVEKGFPKNREEIFERFFKKEIQNYHSWSNQPLRQFAHFLNGALALAAVLENEIAERKYLVIPRINLWSLWVATLAKAWEEADLPVWISNNGGSKRLRPQFISFVSELEVLLEQANQGTSDVATEQEIKTQEISNFISRSDNREVLARNIRKALDQCEGFSRVDLAVRFAGDTLG